MNVAELRQHLAGLPDNMPVVLRDDLNHEPLATVEQHGWHWDERHNWGQLEHDPEPDDDPDDGPYLPALILTT